MFFSLLVLKNHSKKEDLVQIRTDRCAPNDVELVFTNELNRVKEVEWTIKELSGESHTSH